MTDEEARNEIEGLLVYLRGRPIRRDRLVKEAIRTYLVRLELAKVVISRLLADPKGGETDAIDWMKGGG